MADSPEQKETRQQEAVAELMVGILTRHQVLATRLQQGAAVQADFADRSLVPYFYGNPSGKFSDPYTGSAGVWDINVAYHVYFYFKLLPCGSKMVRYTIEIRKSSQRNYCNVKLSRKK